MGFIDRYMKRLMDEYHQDLNARLVRDLGNGLGFLGDAATLAPSATIEGFKGKIVIGRKVCIGRYARISCFDQESSIGIGDASIIHEMTVLDSGPKGRITIGKNSTVNPFGVIYGHGGVTIGDFVRIAAHAVIISASHVFDDPTRPIALQGLTKEGIIIENDVWIGAGCRILDGITIGHGSVIGAGSVVTKSIPPMTIAVGVPARAISVRGQS